MQQSRSIGESRRYHKLAFLLRFFRCQSIMRVTLLNRVSLLHDEIPCFVNTRLRLSTRLVVQVLE